MPFPATLPIGIVGNQAMTFVLAPNLVAKIGLTRPEHLTTMIRQLVDKSRQGLGEGDPTIPVEILGNHLRVARWFVSSMTNPMRGVVLVDGPLPTPPSTMMSGTQIKVPLSSITSTPLS
jgi:hypothetical protein